MWFTNLDGFVQTISALIKDLNSLFFATAEQLITNIKTHAPVPASHPQFTQRNGPDVILMYAKERGGPALTCEAMYFSGLALLS